MSRLKTMLQRTAFRCLGYEELKALPRELLSVFSDMKESEVVKLLDKSSLYDIARIIYTHDLHVVKEDIEIIHWNRLSPEDKLRSALRNGRDMEFIMNIVEELATCYEGNRMNFCMATAASYGRRDLIDFAISNGANDWNEGMYEATKLRDRELVDFFISKGADDWNWGMIYAALNGNRELVEFFLSKATTGGVYLSRGAENAMAKGYLDIAYRLIDRGANIQDSMIQSAVWYGDLNLVRYVLSIPRKDISLNVAMVEAILVGNMELVEFFISEGADDWNSGMVHAIYIGNRELAEFFISKGADDWNFGLQYAALHGDRNLIEFFISKGANNWNMGMMGAISNGDLNLVEFFISKGATDFNKALIYSLHTNGDIIEMLEFFISKGATELDVILNMARSIAYDRRQVIEFLTNKIMEHASRERHDDV